MNNPEPTEPLLVELEVPGRAVVLANILLHSLHESDLVNAGFTKQDIEDFGSFFEEVRYQAENNELCFVDEEDQTDEE